MKKRILSLLLAALLLLVPMAVYAAETLLTASAPTASAPTASAPISAATAAQRLADLGLLAGKGTNADGSIDFDLPGSLTRAESTTQVVRFLGKEAAAQSGDQTHPFTDLPAWAVPYVAYAYNNKVVNGVSATKFDAAATMTDAAFLTLILRVLGYEDKYDGSPSDFSWNNPYALAKSVGLIDSETATSPFTRGDAFLICYKALTAAVKSGDDVAHQLMQAGIFTEAKWNEVTSAPINDTVVITPIAELNQQSENGDHAEDDSRSASLETNYRETVILNSQTTKQSRYDNAYYPRVKKVRDDLYLLLFMYSQYGQHLYYATSSDGLHWNPPQVLWNSADYKFTYEGGAFDGTEDRYHAVNADALVLPSGEVLCVYAVRAPKGYRTYADLCGLFMKRGTPTADGNITWSAEQKIYTGQVWEPSILQRTDGQIHVYFSECAPGIMYYGYHEEHRTDGAGLIVSNDNGKTWTPNVEAGDTNYYRTPIVFQEYVGNMDYPKENGEIINYAHYCAQMPVGVQLYNGKILLAAEIKQTDGKFRISYVISEDNGEWKELAWNAEENETIYKLTNTPNSSPYVDRFLSGEVYLTHNYGGQLRGHIGSPDGTYMSTAFENAPGCAGMWGSCAVVDSHRVITAMQNKLDGGKFSINLYYGYLNHRINAAKASIAVDGFTSDWDAITDALFVGSESQAQFTTRVAHDANNVYFLLSRLDNYLQEGDTTTVCIAAGNTADYRITVDVYGNATVEYYMAGALRETLTGVTVKTTVLGTVGNNDDTDEGAVYEICVPKALVGLSGATDFRIRPALLNKDVTTPVSDTLTGVSTFSTAYWPKVVLD